MKKWGVFSVILVNLLDVYTTMLPTPAGSETNVFARNALYQPILSHLLFIKGIYLLSYLFLGTILYFQIRRFSQWLADLVVVGSCVYFGLQHFETPLRNYLIYLGWYQG